MIILRDDDDKTKVTIEQSGTRFFAFVTERIFQFDGAEWILVGANRKWNTGEEEEGLFENYRPNATHITLPLIETEGSSGLEHLYIPDEPISVLPVRSTHHHVSVEGL